MKTLIAALLMISQVSIAGEKGNGGDAVVCRDAAGAIQTATVLDVHEMTVLRIPSLTTPGQLRDFLDRRSVMLENCNATLFSRVQTESLRLVRAIDEFSAKGEQSDALISFSSEPLGDIDDTKHGIELSANCHVEQLVQRIDSRDPRRSSRYLISAEIIQVLDAKNLAAIALHEAIYQSLRSLGHDNSARVRGIVRDVLRGDASALVAAGLCSAGRP